MTYHPDVVEALQRVTSASVTIKKDFGGGHVIKFRRPVGPKTPDGLPSTVAESVTVDSGELHWGFIDGGLTGNLATIAARMGVRLDALVKEHSSVIDTSVEDELSIEKRRALADLKLMAGTTLEDYDYDPRYRAYKMKSSAVNRILSAKMLEEEKRKKAESFATVTLEKKIVWSETPKSDIDATSDILSKIEKMERAALEKAFGGKMETTTSGETFDLIKAVVARVNAAVLSSDQAHDFCDMWAKVLTLSGAELQIIDGEEWTFTKLVFSERFGRLVVILTPAELGDDIALSASEIEDTFPRLADLINRTVHEASDGKLKNLAALSKLAFDLARNHTAFLRPLSEMTHATVAKAKEVAKQRIDEAKANFYEASPLYGLI